MLTIEFIMTDPKLRTKYNTWKPLPTNTNPAYLQFNQYKIRIFGKEYTSPSQEFLDAFEQSKLWEQLAK